MTEDTSIPWPDGYDNEKMLWRCDGCDVEVPVFSSDPYYPDKVYCPECHQATERKDI